MRGAARATLAALALFAAAAPGEPAGDATSDEAAVLDPVEPPAPPPDVDALLRARVLDPALAGAPSYLRANVKDEAGFWGYVHLTPDAAPIVVAVGLPPDPPRYASRAEGREAVLDGVRIWVRALMPHVPWFAVHFVEEDPDADVTIRWKRRITGPYCGFGGIRYRVEKGGALRVSGYMEIATRPSGDSLGLTVGDLRQISAHEFGHALGLDHCLRCNSIMGEASETRGVVTASDVNTYLLLLAQPNGVRHVGGPLFGLAQPGWALGAP